MININMKKRIVLLFVVTILGLTSYDTAKAVVLLPQAKIQLASDQEVVRPGTKIKFTAWLNGLDLVSAVGGKIYFDRAVFDIVKVNTSNSIINLWVAEPKKSATTINFGGGIMYPGFEGLGELFNFELQVKASTSASSSDVLIINNEVLSSDGSGQALRSTTTPVKIIIATSSSIKLGFDKLVIKSPTHETGQWSRNKNPWFSWNAGYQIAYGFNTRNNTIPVSSLKNLSSISFSDVKDGIYYFHLKFVDKVGANKVLRYKTMIDTKKPTNFIVTKVLPKKAGDKLSVTIKAKDALSGIAYYNVIIDGKGNKMVKNSFTTAIKQGGSHRLTIRVFDKAGNYAENISNFIVK